MVCIDFDDTNATSADDMNFRKKLSRLALSSFLIQFCEHVCGSPCSMERHPPMKTETLEVNYMILPTRTDAASPPLPMAISDVCGGKAKQGQ